MDFTGFTKYCSSFIQNRNTFQRSLKGNFRRQEHQCQSRLTGSWVVEAEVPGGASQAAVDASLYAAHLRRARWSQTGLGRALGYDLHAILREEKVGAVI